MTVPRVSIVIPFRNHVGYIEKAWRQIEAQSYKDWELIFVDNQSADGSGAVAKEIEKKRSGKVRCIESKTPGIPFARNRGLAEARGKYVTFLDVDDRFAPDKLDRLVAVLDLHHDVAMSYGLTNRVYLPKGDERIQDPGIAKDGRNEPPLLAMDWIRCFYHLPQTGATLVRTEVARKVGGFDEGLVMGNDDVAFHVAIALEYCIWFERRHAVTYYRHRDSAGAEMNRQRGVSLRYLDTCSRWVVPHAIDYAASNGDVRPLYWARRALWSNLLEHADHYSRSEGMPYSLAVKNLLRVYAPFGYLAGYPYSLLKVLSHFLPYSGNRLAVRIAFRMLHHIDHRRFPLVVEESDQG